MIFGILLNAICILGPQEFALGTRKANLKTDKEMIYVPAGEFTLGDEEFKDARPSHKVFLDGYWIGKNLVTVGDFRKFCKEADYKYDWTLKKPRWGLQEDFPMLYVNWDEASAYAKWAGGDLPTEAQWEKAAKGPTDRKFPWGNTFDPDLLCSSAKEKRKCPMDVGRFPKGASPYGCLDMAGNAAQWCKDWYVETGYDAANNRNPTGPKTGTERVAKGGNWFFKPEEMFRCSFKGNLDPSLRLFGIGFRICLPAHK